MYDAIVVGAGPIGSYTAYQLAELGFEVVLIEEDEEVGKDVICTGVIGTEAFERFNLPQRAIISEIKSIVFFSPSLLTINYTPSDTLAYVVDRDIFDKEILQAAQRKGVDVYLGEQVRRINTYKDFVEVESWNGNSLETLRAKLVILATGVNYRLQRSLGLGIPPSFLKGAQTEVEVKNLRQTEIYVGRQISPGSFAWAMPLGNGWARIGVLAESKGVSHLEEFLKMRFAGRIKQENPRIVQKRIACGAVKRSVKDRILAVGEAAGQVKTTTGGGIFYGLLCSEIAVHVLQKAFSKGDLSQRGLFQYERLWRSKLGKELKMGQWARKVLRKLTDKQIDKIFRFVREKAFIKKLLEKKVKFDYHASLISSGLKLLRPK
ncbi:NAD(P)/FAD-dependent oxidoreductase [Candidatus Aerophobetes bacterium]|uniref:NAD(P)/FAD-dependent oxidoreductase n=1 Tax=Aerophobetes bacterium TaxID=2030807 RepID=A0A523RW25_UNCAE|nr:MAG: NAD(P)/FAD-dependent oxidoreductase [Candidatus Aerophobetes bacterium]